MTSAAPRLLTIPETAQRLSCSQNTVYRLIGRGELNAVDIGHGRAKTRVREDNLTAFIDERTRNARELRSVRTRTA